MIGLELQSGLRCGLASKSHKGANMFDFFLGMAFVLMVIGPALVTVLQKPDSSSDDRRP
jgi:hypothetical protein